ncbi:MAG: hypothetical protein U0802_20350 [Candidatus Binatia bacterium]
MPVYFVLAALAGWRANITAESAADDAGKRPWPRGHADPDQHPPRPAAARLRRPPRRDHDRRRARAPVRRPLRALRQPDDQQDRAALEAACASPSC